MPACIARRRARSNRVEVCCALCTCSDLRPCHGRVVDHGDAGAGAAARRTRGIRILVAPRVHSGSVRSNRPGGPRERGPRPGAEELGGTGRRLPHTRSRHGGRTGAARAGLRARLRGERPDLRELHRLAGHRPGAFHPIAGNPLHADPSTRFDLVWPDGQPFIEKPFTNHNGGHVAFGPDGYLYFGLGDGGSGNDPFTARRIRRRCSARCCASTSRWLTRIRKATTCRRQPFVADGRRLAEIWAFGFRNPWRWSFDDPALGGTGALIIADVGQEAWEEINYEPAGAGGRNYGWRNREGRARQRHRPAAVLNAADRSEFCEYPHPEGRAITGGVVYRGTALAASYQRPLLLCRLRGEPGLVDWHRYRFGPCGRV